jgi:hypothetical protein
MHERRKIRLTATDRSELEAVVANRTVGKNTFGERRLLF